MTHPRPNPLPPAAALLLLASQVAAQDPVEERLRKLEQQNQQLQQQIDSLSKEVERTQLGEAAPAIGPAARGVGQGAAKVYGLEQGLSIGGYGEYLFTQRSGRSDVADALRAVLYVGYKFDDHWVLNTELEVEHATTADDSGEVSLEFGYLDYMARDELNLRGGLVLVPMGLVNELHEPTSFLPGSRPQTERRILPTTWRELGLGAYGDLGGFTYRTYLVTALDGAGFSDSGLRGGRQQGSEVEADDFAVVGRLDYVDVPGLLVGGSVYYGNTGQDGFDDGGIPVPDMPATILEAHAEYRTGPWTLRALYASAEVQDAAQFNAATGNNLAERMQGYYGELGYDLLAALLPECKQELTPFLRYEVVDTQEEMAGGLPGDPGQEDVIWTLGLDYKPIPQVVIKVDFEEWDNDYDRFNFVLGYVF